jgi:subtilisin family serine protease
VNAVVVKATVAAVREIAARADVERVEADLVVELIEPVAPGESKGRDARGIGMTPGVQAIEADRVWTELGVDGTGAIVGNMDTGVDLSHPSLSARWRGNTEPVAECWLDSADLGDATPADQHYLGHGTHVMGTIAGLALDDTIGVAPGAVWIASNAIYQGTGTEFDNDVIASLEWFADPDGNPATMDEVPDVVQNSWGVNEGFSGYYDCDSRWWTAIDNCEAAGVVLTWSAGNEGSGSTSLRSPADRADSETNCFSVGSTLPTAPYAISGFSSRGPSGCGGAFAVKPEVVAPGEDIYSAQPGGGYQYLSGTSMAGPHVAGVVALMRSANPNVDVVTIKTVLMNTATDLGDPGEENTYGRGMINAYNAVLAVMGGLGTVEGYVTDSGTGLPIEGAVVADVGGFQSVSTDSTGLFSMMLSAEPHSLAFSFFGYLPDTLSVTVVEDSVTDASHALTTAPQARLHGFVYGPTGAPQDSATIEALGTPVAPAMSDPTGAYELFLPQGGTYEVRASASGVGAAQETVTLLADSLLHFNLPVLYREDFETGDFSMYPWAHSGSADWTVDASTAYEGSYSARSGSITHNQESVLSLDVHVDASGDLSFWYLVSSEANYDYLEFFVDGGQAGGWSGTVGWSEAVVPVTAGTHTFTWKYTKDGSVDTGSDAAWVDYITFPTLGPIPRPELSVAPALVAETVEPNGFAQSTVTLTNSGDADLDYSISWVTAGPKARQRETIDLAKGEDDPRVGEAPIAGQGGPDAFGYSWIDSDEPGGPIYAWEEINAIGTAVSVGDDWNVGPYGLGFSFNFYGTVYDSVRICSNGWLSFTSSATTYTNQGIPNSSDPNALLAGFWDDLNPSSGGTIYYYADVANARFIVEWDGIHHYYSGNPETFQIILNADGSIVYQYAIVASDASCTVGIEDPTGTDGLEVLMGVSGYLHNNLAIQFAAAEPPAPWLVVSPLAGTVVPGASADLTVDLDAAGLAEAVYTGTITIASNDPGGSVDVPVTLTVQSSTGAAMTGLPEEMALGAPRPNPFRGTTSISFDIPEGDGSAVLRVYDIAGRAVRTLTEGSVSPGSHTAVWDGTDSGGRRVAGGIYFYRLTAGDFDETRKVVLLR